MVIENKNDRDDEIENNYKDIMSGIENSFNALDKSKSDINNVENSDSDSDSDLDVNSDSDLDLDLDVDSDSDSDSDDNEIATNNIEEEIQDLPNEYQEKYRLEKRKRKSVLADRQRLEDENKYLKQNLNSAVNDSTEMYGRELYSDLEKIKSIKKQILLGNGGDDEKAANLLLEAEDIYQETIHKINQYKNYVNQSQFSHDDTNDSNNQDSEDSSREDQERLSNAQEWIEDHPELIEDSYQYNSTIQKEVGTFISEFDRKLIKAGKADAILSDEYLEVLDNFIDEIKPRKSQNNYTNSAVGGVKNNFSSGGGQSVRIQLSSTEKDFAKSIGVSNERFLREKILDIEKQKKGNKHYG